MSQRNGGYTPIDFDAVERALLDGADRLVPDWLPGGKKVGPEWVCADLSGGEGRSCSVNLVKGYWSDFASGERGKNLLDLYCAVYGKERVDAARELMPELGLAPAAAQTSAPPPPQKRAAPAAAPGKKPVADEGWTTVTPVPEHAPPATFKHYARRDEDIEHVADYRDELGLYGHVVRFRTSDGGKDPLPRTWCTSSKDGASCWKWKQWDVPRPLYLPGHQRPAGRTVVLVEGEKKGDALQALLDGFAPGVYCVASWPGGSKAWKKANWSWLAGAHVLCWPDCDAKREPLTAAERQGCADEAARLVLQAAKPLLPADKQPGMQAMLGIGSVLRADHGCTVQLLPIPAPGEVVDGWDCGDAVAEGWDGERVLGFFAGAYALPAWAGGDKPKPTGGDATPPGPPGEPGAGADDDGAPDDAFQEHIEYLAAKMECEIWQIGVNRNLVMAALNKAPALVGCLAYNDLTNALCTVRPWPWRDEPGLVADNDDLRLGEWLSRTYKLKAASRAALDEAIQTVADGSRFHPIRDWLKSIKHDGRPRLKKWLLHALGMDLAKVGPRRQEYLGLMGQYMLMGLVARVMQPGCKFDYSPVLEGKTGMGKSTFVEVLVGKAHFSDTHFDIGNGKDGMEQLEGLWAYELSEMTAFRRADSEQVKQFFSSTVDRYRGAYGKFVRPHPRQCVIFCTTNKRQYLYDLTGNRRFWPVWVDQRIRLQWLLRWREQLFAEAYALWAAGERYFPTYEEEERYFVPEQRQRLVETTVQARMFELLTREGALPTEGRATSQLSQDTSFVTMPELCQALGADPAKSTAQLESQIRSWLDAYGWLQHREGGGGRRRGFRRPEVWPPPAEDDDDAPPAPPASEASTETGSAPTVAVEPDGGSDDEPF
jgi:predicted P-loop ATPase